ncbi:hypothetical protein [Desmospora activa]|uniref:Uncharacterized protein n=1 Tax=Desmospora activa DSM 45169 TaxID=1121389 RepID=A0A2T4Z7W7_9BACL|nr:hypothetical protein [Desmospora activa]PTM57974.1 hypothetical protein C8J48_0545 [Desmospora activa DSM 45169]
MEDTPATGEYRLARFHNKVGVFAQVRVEMEATDADDDPRVIWAVDPSDSSSAQPELDPKETEEAMIGVKNTLGSLAAMGIEVSGVVIRVIHVGISLVDTVPTAVRAAAGAATADAFGVADCFHIVFDDGWKCRLKT